MSKTKTCKDYAVIRYYYEAFQIQYEGTLASRAQLGVQTIVVINADNTPIQLVASYILYGASTLSQKRAASGHWSNM